MTFNHGVRSSILRWLTKKTEYPVWGTLFFLLVLPRRIERNSPCRAVCRKAERDGHKIGLFAKQSRQVENLPILRWLTSSSQAPYRSFFRKLKKLTHSAVPPLRKKSRSVFLFGCKRPHNEKLSLPIFCGFWCFFCGEIYCRGESNEIVHVERYAVRQSETDIKSAYLRSKFGSFKSHIAMFLFLCYNIKKHIYRVIQCSESLQERSNN